MPKKSGWRSAADGSMIEFVDPTERPRPGYLRAGSATDRASRHRSFRGVVGTRRSHHGHRRSPCFARVQRRRAGPVSRASCRERRRSNASDGGTRLQRCRNARCRRRGRLSARARRQRVGVMGFCMGGALAMLSVMHGVRFDAASIWYGYPPAEAGDPAAIGVPIQGHWALEDGFFTDPGRRCHRKQAQSRQRCGIRVSPLRRQARLLQYGRLGKGGLGHYHREHAETAWQRTIEFFDRTLR